jgi:hypothetical protein
MKLLICILVSAVLVYLVLSFISFDPYWVLGGEKEGFVWRAFYLFATTVTVLVIYSPE